MKNETILTGLRANNVLHIGNYFGALLPIIDMAKEKSGQYQINLFVPDLHSFTTPIDHTKLKSQIDESLRIFAAAGLPLGDDNVHVYRQSYIPAHSELTVILNSFAGIGELSRMTQYKEKSTNLGTSRVSAGLFDYPVLMAADILLYNAKYVPVGDDQTQHLEFTRDLAQRMNSKFGELFVIPEAVKKQHEFFGKDQGLRVRDLQEPDKKMSKSADSQKGIIFLNDDPAEAVKKIKAAATDNVGRINYDYTNQPGISNLLDIYQLLGGSKAEFIGQQQYGTFKSVVAKKVEEFLCGFQMSLAQVDKKAVENKLLESESLMNKQANLTLLKVQKAVGIR